MKNKIIITLILSLFSFILVGCGNDYNNQENIDKALAIVNERYDENLEFSRVKRGDGDVFGYNDANSHFYAKGGNLPEGTEVEIWQSGDAAAVYDNYFEARYTDEIKSYIENIIGDENAKLFYININTTGPNYEGVTVEEAMKERNLLDSVCIKILGETPEDPSKDYYKFRKVLGNLVIKNLEISYVNQEFFDKEYDAQGLYINEYRMGYGKDENIITYCHVYDYSSNDNELSIEKLIKDDTNNVKTDKTVQKITVDINREVRRTKSSSKIT